MNRKKRKQILIWISRHGLSRMMLLAVLIVLCITLFTYEYSSTRTWTHWTLPLSGKTIVLDAGHGGPDGGARSKSGIEEEHITLKLVMQLRDYLQEAGALVVLTRDGDYDLASPGTKGYSRRKTEDLLKRLEIVQQSEADLFVTVHLNSSPSPRWRGAQTFFYPGREDSRKLAVLIQEEIKTNLMNTDRVANTVSSVFLLKESTIPSALIEVGFLSNPDEARLLADPVYQSKLAASIYRGILRFSSGESIGTF